ncbi:hypothetical protein PENTCL1PPCAC_14408, partial [Pristionchus entomophagus]
AHEGTHGHRVVHHALACVLSGRGSLRLEAGAGVDAVMPRVGLEHERHSLGSSASEDDGVDGHSLRVLPLRVDDGALSGGGGESRV